MLPYIAQGAGQEIEDAGVLAIFLLLVDELDTVFRVYVCVRKERADVVQRSARERWMVLRLVYEVL